MQEYTTSDKDINGYVKFNDESKLVIYLNEEELKNYKIYDYITVVGLLDNFKKSNEELTLINTKVEDNDLYSHYTLEVIESNIDDVFVNYAVDNYELDYVLKDGKFTFNDLIKDAYVREENNHNIYELDKFNILVCSNKNIILKKDLGIDYSLCE